MIERHNGIDYTKPEVILLQETGIGTAEYAARTCYNSFVSSENDCIKMYNNLISREHKNETLETSNLKQVNGIEHSDLLDQLAWTHFHYSILEHANLTFLIKGMPRGVLQEHARHRIQAISVKSTRYTMQDILHAFNSTSICLMGDSKLTFRTFIKEMSIFSVIGKPEDIEIDTMYDKLHHQLRTLGNEGFLKISMGKAALEVYGNRDVYESPRDLFNSLKDCKAKRNVGDPFKWLVTDTWKTDLVVTMNLRALKNYLELRDSGAAYFGIRMVATAMKEVIPSKYLDLIVKKDSNGK